MRTVLGFIMILLLSIGTAPSQGCTRCTVTGNAFPIVLDCGNSYAMLSENTTCTYVGGNATECVVTGTFVWEPMGEDCCSGGVIDWAQDNAGGQTPSTGQIGGNSAVFATCAIGPVTGYSSNGVVASPSGATIACTSPASTLAVQATIRECTGAPNNPILQRDCSGGSNGPQFTASKVYSCVP